MQEQSIKSNIPEIRALRILETYEGFNNYILGIKRKVETQKHYKITRPQADYIIDFHKIVPKGCS